MNLLNMENPVFEVYVIAAAIFSFESNAAGLDDRVPDVKK